MTLLQWVEEERIRLAKFEKWWAENRAAFGSDLYPANMDAGEWDEQFRAWSDEQ